MKEDTRRIVVSVIFVTRNRLATLRQLLLALANQDYPQELFEVVVLDNGSTDGTRLYLTAMKKDNLRLKVIFGRRGENLSIGKMRNLGVKKSQGEILLFTDDDCLPPTDWIRRMVDGLARYPMAAGVGGCLKAPAPLQTQNPIAQFEKWQENHYFKEQDREYLSWEINQHPFQTNNIAYRRDVFVKVSGFDERLPAFTVGEDTDLKERVLRLGRPLLFLPLCVTHLQDYSFLRLFRQSLARGAAILFAQAKKKGRLPSRFQSLLRLSLAPFFFARMFWKTRSFDLSAVATFALLVRQIGKIKFYRSVVQITADWRKEKRLLFLDHTPFTGGGELVLASHLASLMGSGFAIHVGASAQTPTLLERFRVAGARVHLLRFGHLKKRPLLGFCHFVTDWISIYHLINREGINLVATNTVRACLSGSLAAILARRPLIWFLRDYTYPRLFIRIFHRFAARILAVSRDVAQFYGLSDYAGCEVMYVGSDLYRFLKSQPLLPRDSKKTIIGFVGRFVAWKGPLLLLEVFESIKDEFPQARIVFVGGGEGQEESVEARLKTQSEKESFLNRVLILDWQPKEKLPSVYASFDLFVHPVLEKEPFATTVVEALQAGLPVIGVNIGGDAEIIKDGREGFLIPPGNLEALTLALRKLLQSRELRRKMGRAARKRGLEFKAETIDQRLRALYRKILN